MLPFFIPSIFTMKILEPNDPLQYSCLENPRDGGTWWAAVYGVAESDTTEETQQQLALKQLQFYKLNSITKILSISGVPFFSARQWYAIWPPLVFQDKLEGTQASDISENILEIKRSRFECLAIWLSPSNHTSVLTILTYLPFPDFNYFSSSCLLFIKKKNNPQI